MTSLGEPIAASGAFAPLRPPACRQSGCRGERDRCGRLVCRRRPAVAGCCCVKPEAGGAALPAPNWLSTAPGAEKAMSASGVADGATSAAVCCRLPAGAAPAAASTSLGRRFRRIDAGRRLGRGQVLGDAADGAVDLDGADGQNDRRGGKQQRPLAVADRLADAGEGAGLVLAPSSPVRLSPAGASARCASAAAACAARRAAAMKSARRSPVAAFCGGATAGGAIAGIGRRPRLGAVRAGGALFGRRRHAPAGRDGRPPASASDRPPRARRRRGRHGPRSPP